MYHCVCCTYFTQSENEIVAFCMQNWQGALLLKFQHRDSEWVCQRYNLLKSNSVIKLLAHHYKI